MAGGKPCDVRIAFVAGNAITSAMKPEANQNTSGIDRSRRRAKSSAAASDPISPLWWRYYSHRDRRAVRRSRRYPRYRLEWRRGLLLQQTDRQRAVVCDSVIDNPPVIGCRIKAVSVNSISASATASAVRATKAASRLRCATCMKNAIPLPVPRITMAPSTCRYLMRKKNVIASRSPRPVNAHFCRMHGWHDFAAGGTGRVCANQIQCADLEFSTCPAPPVRTRRDIVTLRSVLVRDRWEKCPLSAQRSR